MWSSSPTPELEADPPHRRPQRDPKQRLSNFNGAVLAFLLGTIALGTLLVATGHALALDLILWLSYVKLYISTTKMVPQAWINYRRKSTVGWSIENILLDDFTGGVLSLCVVPSASSRSRSTARPTVARLADLAPPSLPPSPLSLALRRQGPALHRLVGRRRLARHHRQPGQAVRRSSLSLEPTELG